MNEGARAGGEDPSAAAMFAMGDVTEVTNRLQSMYDLRTRLEDLAAMHKSEEDGLRETMAGLIMQCNEQQVKIDGLQQLLVQKDAKLVEAQRDNVAAVEMVATFRREGELIMGKLKKALAEAQGNYEGEKEARQKIQQTFDAKLTAYQGLLQEQEKVKDKLKHKTQQLEIKLANAEKMLKDMSTQDGFNKHYLDIAAELKQVESKVGGVATPGGGSLSDASLEHKVRLQEQIIRMLFAKLQTEQNHRLETEEQAAVMVAAEEDAIRKLEEKLREAETERDASRASASGTPRMSGLGTPRVGTPRRVGTPLRPRRVPSLESPSPPKNGAPAGGAAAPAFAPAAAAPVSSLESQLAEVTNDFNRSLEMWSRKLMASNAGAGTPASHVAAPAGGDVEALLASVHSLSTPAAAHAAAAASAPDTGMAMLEGVRSPPAGDETDYLPDTPLPAAPPADLHAPPYGVGSPGDDQEFQPESPDYHARPLRSGP